MNNTLSEPKIHESAKIRNCQLGNYTEVDERVRLTDSIIGDYSYVLHDSEMIYTELGKFCAIAPFVRINPGNHPYWRPAMSNFTYRSKNYGFGDNDQEFFEWRKSFKTKIGHDVWIGQGALILPGVNLGVGSIVGGGAVVTKSVEDYSIVAGNPAKVIRRRFSKNVVDSLLRIEWWNWSHEKIKEEMKFFRLKDINIFCKRYDQDFNDITT